VPIVPCLWSNQKWFNPFYQKIFFSQMFTQLFYIIKKYFFLNIQNVFKIHSNFGLVRCFCINLEWDKLMKKFWEPSKKFGWVWNRRKGSFVVTNFKKSKFGGFSKLHYLIDILFFNTHTHTHALTDTFTHKHTHTHTFIHTQMGNLLSFNFQFVLLHKI